MMEIEFIYDGKSTKIKCNKENTMKDIFQEYSSKINKDYYSLIFFYEKEKISGNLNLILFMYLYDINNNNIEIKVYDKLSLINQAKYEFNDIICPICLESTQIKIKDYRIFLDKCKNGHKIDNILLNEFKDNQNLAKSKIKCNNKNCKENNNIMKIFKCLKKIFVYYVKKLIIIIINFILKIKCQK